jgi:hypothetical protein
MNIETWKADLIKEIETAAENRAVMARDNPDDPRIEQSQKALFDLADKLRALPSDHAELNALFREESEFGALQRSTVGEPEGRYRGAKEDLLAAYGLGHATFATAEAFLRVLRDQVGETISEYRLRV